jgi:lipid II:glycine glycyltransferase (peptidoglycan interpeptide bridge formation enzyme)
MQIQVVTEVIDGLEKNWDDFVLNHPDGNFFQSPAYYNFYKSLPSYEPILLISKDDSDNITGSLIAVIQKEKGYLKGKLSSRCIVYGGPIVKDNSGEVADKLLKELTRRVACKSIYIEFRNLVDLSKSKEVFVKYRFEYKEHFNFVVGIGSAEENFKKLNENRKRQIKKSLKSGVEILSAKEMSEVKEFYTILKTLYKEKVKKPLPAFSFFEHFFSDPNLGKYFLVKYEGKIIGGIMCPIFKETIYEWYVCGLDNEYKDQSPSVLATWAVIEYAGKNGLKYFDFLGAGSADSDYGVREFKSKFGGELVQYGRFLRINNKLLYNIGKLGLKVLKKL